VARGRLALVGGFVIGGLLLFAIGIFMIGNRRMLFEQRFEVHTHFSRVTGLQVGAIVRVAGMNAGEVLEVNVPRSPAERFRVRMRVREDLRPIVRTDSVASIQTDGLVGSRFVQIEAGTEQAPIVEDEAAIPGRDPFDIADLMQQASDTVATVNETIVTLRDDVESAIETLTETAHNANKLIVEVSDDVRSMSEDGAAIVTDARTLVARVQAGEGTIGKLLNDDEMYQRARSIAEQTEQTMRNVREVTDEARGVVADFRAEAEQREGAVAGIQRTLEHARTATSNLAEATEALKHNFLFRGYFERRGFYDLGNLTVAAYRGGQLEGRDRTAVRVWVPAAEIFEYDADGVPQLTQAGRARLDRAMADVLKYPADSPLVVEGYVADRDLAPDQAFLESRTRAEQVREHLVTRFHRSPNLTGFLPLGFDAEGSPAGTRRWDGVAIAVFVENRALRALTRRAERTE
jgi:phospholipid/cholesterol/gamma-HCH transport system substrate-binding protein